MNTSQERDTKAHVTMATQSKPAIRPSIQNLRSLQRKLDGTSNSQEFRF